MEYMMNFFNARWPKAGMKEARVVGDLPPFSVSGIRESDRLALPRSWSYSIPCNSRQISVWFYGPSLREFKRCEDGHLELTSGWTKVVKKGNFQVGEVVTLWIFKDCQQPSSLWLAMHYKVKQFIEGSVY